MGMGHEEFLTGRKGPNAVRRGRQEGGGRIGRRLVAL